MIFFDTNFKKRKNATNGIKTLMNNATVMNIVRRLSLIFPSVLLYILMFPDERDLTSFATRWPQMLSQLYRLWKSLFLLRTLESLCPGFIIQHTLLFTLPSKVSLQIIEISCCWDYRISKVIFKIFTSIISKSCDHIYRLDKVINLPIDIYIFEIIYFPSYFIK